MSISDEAGKIDQQDIMVVSHLILDCKDRGGKVVLAGNGGSAAICSHFVNDLIKAVGVPAISLTDNVPTLTAYSNDLDYGVALGEIADVLLNKNDMLFLMTTSGQSTNILHLAVRFKIPVVALVGNGGGRMSQWAKNVFIVVTGGFDARSNEDLFSIITHAIVDYIENDARAVR